MLRVCLTLASLLRSEPISIQREILNRLSKRRPQLDFSSKELLEIYEHANELLKSRRTQSLKWSGFIFLMNYPKSALNLMSNRKVPVEDLERFRNMVHKTK